MDNKPSRVVVVHPDLGVGGAERLIVDLCKALQQSKHYSFDVDIYTGYHDRNRCFEETRDGSLNVHTIGKWIPRNFFGRFHALLAYLKILYIAIYLLLFKDFDVFICDQVPICLPVLRLKPKLNIRSRKFIFYCHFPDQLLTTRKTTLKTWYRNIIDWIEESSIRAADTVLVNSEFTKKVFCDTFKSWKNNPALKPPEVLYPCVDVTVFSSYEPSIETKLKLQYLSDKSNFIFLSLNRFERKKDLGLAIRAFGKFFATYKKQNNISPDKDPHLVVAGGFDPRLSECVDYYSELEKLVDDLSLTLNVTFIKTPSDDEKMLLLALCKVVIYTPQNEHFGIVPLEAMAMSKPVIAPASGGPLETIVVDEANQTGYLCQPEDRRFSDAMIELVMNNMKRQQVGNAGFKRVVDKFSFQVFQRQIEQYCVQTQ